MNVLFLGYRDSPLIDFIRSLDDRVEETDEKISVEDPRLKRADFIVSYGYRHILPESVLTTIAPRNAINLHISFLPWGRGTDPVLWALVDECPLGVSIHYLSKAVDAGNIIVQEEFNTSGCLTYKDVYRKAHANMRDLFVKHWKSIRTQSCDSIPQKVGGSYHTSKDRLRVFGEGGFDEELPINALRDMVKARLGATK